MDDLTASGDSYTTNYEKIFCLEIRKSMIYLSEYAEGLDKMDAYISPLFGDFRGFPSMLIQVGGDEMLLSDSVDVAAKARSQGMTQT